jgi:hypothetical protein
LIAGDLAKMPRRRNVVSRYARPPSGIDDEAQEAEASARRTRRRRPPPPPTQEYEEEDDEEEEGGGGGEDEEEEGGGGGDEEEEGGGGGDDSVGCTGSGSSGMPKVYQRGPATLPDPPLPHQRPLIRPVGAT